MESNKYLIGADVGFAHFGLSAFKLDESEGIEFVGSASLITTKATKASKTRVDSDNIRRVDEMVYGIERFLRTINPHQSAWGLMFFVSAEFPTGGTQNAKAAYSFGLGTGLLVTLLRCRNIAYEHVTPDEVKFVSTGRRQKVDKLQVQKGIEELMRCEGISFRGKNLTDYLNETYSDKELHEHVADSIAAAYWSMVNSQNYKAFIS